MKTFDIEKTLNPELVDGAFLTVENKIYQVTNMDRKKIYLKNESSESLEIDDKKWRPIKLDELWLSKFNLEINSKIRNKQTNLDWIIKSKYNYYYITNLSNSEFFENPFIPLKYVHDLQRWYFILTNKKILYSNK
jgi:hypothetical protein